MYKLGQLCFSTENETFFGIKYIFRLCHNVPYIIVGSKQSRVNKRKLLFTVLTPKGLATL